MEHQHIVQRVDLASWPDQQPPMPRLSALGAAPATEPPTDEYGQPDIYYAVAAQQQAAASPADPPPAAEGTITRRVELPSGGWAEIADAKKIRAKHRKRALDQLNIERLQAGTAGVALDMTDGLILMMILKWYIPYSPFEGTTSPLDKPSLLGELEIPDYDTLTNELDGARRLLFPAPPSPDNMKPGSPTPPAGA